ncbi:hypothetical protein ABZ547_29320 [Streptomyces sparsogenes]|uniref:hypothetical protein n=1 Tax=Streptomyces sparsogenes TaxID=67365 RepID=UPI0033F0E7C8
MYIRGRYKNAGYWYDGGSGKPFAPGVYYWVGGNTRFYGAMLPRFRCSDFTEVEHQEGVSRAWPFTYDDLEPFYNTMESLLQVHGQTGEDPTEPPRSKPYPCPALDHEPEIERFARSLRGQGLYPFHTPNAPNVETQAGRRDSDRFPFTSQRPLGALRSVLPRDAIIVAGSATPRARSSRPSRSTRRARTSPPAASPPWAGPYRPEGCLYCRMVVDLGFCDHPSVGMISDRGSATALPDLLSTAGLLPVAGPVDRREQRRDPCPSS